MLHVFVCLLLFSGKGIRYQRYSQGHQNKSITQSREHMSDITCIYMHKAAEMCISFIKSKGDISDLPFNPLAAKRRKH